MSLGSEYVTELVIHAVDGLLDLRGKSPLALSTIQLWSWSREHG
jgi:hypothetical protein